MRFLAILIGVLSVHCTFGTQCQKPTKESSDDCMKIIHPTHGELLGNVPYMPQQCLEGIATLLKDVRRQIEGRRSSNPQCMKDLLNRLDDISNGHLRKIISVDSSVKQSFIGVYTALGNAIVGAQQCVDKPHASCEEIQLCCSDVKSKLYTQRNVNLENISDFLIEFKTQFGKVCDSVTNSIRDLQRDVNSTTSC
ncbi:hypothetical protein PPYR_11249 [Photinus pyralis]|uniref:Protein TsetseEP domain-containing protein n=1 Tax=Photinus pyralis TaxID=7054 RepID=A0A5N4AAQ7_PHOPY|nr:hypothetical protein PPYR_11249 [Photinus pyralis]